MGAKEIIEHLEIYKKEKGFNFLEGIDDLIDFTKYCVNIKTQQLQAELKEAKEMMDTLNKELKQRIETDKNF